MGETCGVPQGHSFRFAPQRRTPPLRTSYRRSFRRGRCPHRPAVLRKHPLPLPLGEAAERSEDGEGEQWPQNPLSRLRRQLSQREEPRLPKKPRRVRRSSGENSEIRFPPRHVRGGKHFSGRKCAKCPRPMDIECALRTAAYPSKNVLKFFDGLRQGQSPCPTGLAEVLFSALSKGF